MSKPKCTRQVIAEAVKLKKGGANNKDIARAIGVHESTFSHWMTDPKTDEQHQLCQEMKKAEVDYKAALLGIIAKQAQNRDWKAAAWLLERKYPEEYARPEVQFAKRAAKEAVEEAIGSASEFVVKIAEAAGGAVTNS